MKKLLLLFSLLSFLIFLLTDSQIYCQTSGMKDSIRNMLVEMKQETHVKSLVAGVWKGDQEILTLALGESMTSVPADIGMSLRIGGISETFIGTLVMILVDKGKIKLEDKISKCLPDLLAADKVTVGMLIKNTAGYKDYVLNKDFVNLITQEPFRYISWKEIINYSTSDGQLNFPPGTQQRYSHTEFTILGEVLEKATGQLMPELYEEYIFRPLNLEHTGYSKNAELPCPALHAFSSDRGIYEDATYWNPSWTGESGPLYSTIPDLGKWALKFGKGSLLTPHSFDVRVGRPEGANHSDPYFASGFGVSNGWYFQNPSYSGYSGAFGYLPAKELAIIIFTTQSEENKTEGQAFQILQEITKKLMPENAIKF